jgi:outer membrane immunogenic protein
MAKKLVLTAAMISLAMPAFAADMIAPAPVKAQLPAQIFNWTGFYIGAHGGGAWSKWTGIDPTDPTATWSSVTASGGVVGSQIGGNYQIGNVVVGLEGTGAWSSVTLSSNSPFGGGAGFIFSLKNDYIATVAGRFGVAFDRVLLYAKGGAALA